MENSLKDTVKGFSATLGKFIAGDKLRLLDDKSGKEAGTAHVEDDSSLSRILAGEIGAILGFYFPSELLGGCCPRVVGEEENIAWNAAAEAADSERIHVTWQAQGDKIWYLAVRSSDLAAHPNTWCPFAALLPGQKDAIHLSACYTYYTDEAATMMTLTGDSLQIHRGTSSVLRIKAERTVRELGENVPIIELTPDSIEKMTPVPWFSLSLFEDRARRIWATLSVFSALILTGVATLVWLLTTMSVVALRADLGMIKSRAQDKSMQLMRTVQTLRASPMREQLGRFADLNDGLLTLNGYLEFYQIKNSKPLWLAVVPTNITSNRISDIGGQTLDSGPTGVVIGNSRDALTRK